jgi:lysylphosphatidylglycerol synthetase-like protein (DUF2156 family)
LSTYSTNYSIADHIALWGNSASIALLDPACKIFTSPHVPGIIGYRLESNNVIVFGDPLCPPEHTQTLIRAFHDAFEDKVANILYIAVSEPFTNWSLEHTCKSAMSIGHEIIIDPSHDPRIGSGEKAAQLRRKCKQATRIGIQAHEYTAYDPAIETMMETLGETWLKNRKGPQIYLQHLHIFIDREHKRYFYAQHHGTIVGVLILNRIDAYKGWVLSFSMVPDGALKGTSEFMILYALDVLRTEGCTFFSIGMIPIASLDRIEGLGYMTTWFARATYGVAKKIFGFGERQQRYWKKFRPKTETMYLMMRKPKIGINGVVGIMRALNTPL